MTFSPRLNQISELTRGLELPFEALRTEHLSIIAEVLSNAWGYLLDKHSATLLAGTEAEVNALMEARLDQLLEENPLWEQMVRCVSRGKESLSYDGSHLEKRPDLSIHLSCRTAAFPLVVECKLIDLATKKGHDLYCEKGLKRFLTGEYAWGTQEAFMLAYVRDASSISATLVPPLALSMAVTPQPYAVLDLPSLIGIHGLDLAKSKHARDFSYPHRSPPLNAPGPIDLWHLWLRCKH